MRQTFRLNASQNVVIYFEMRIGYIMAYAAHDRLWKVQETV